MLSKVTDYLKNVGKSVVYVASDVIKEDNEFIAEFASTNREVFTAAYSSVKNYRTTINKIESSFKASKIYQAADIGVKAIFEDLRTGKFYNKAREEEIASKLGGFDMTDDFDMEEFEKSLENRDISEGDKAVADAVTKSTRLSGELVSDTVARSASAVIANQKASDRLFFTQNVQMISGIQAVAETTGLVGKTINNTNQMLKTMADNQKTFYESTSKNLDTIRAMMQEMLEMQRNLYNDQRKAQQDANDKKRQKYTDIISGNGVLDLQEYGKNVKNNLNRILSDKGLGMLLNGFGDNGNMLAQFVSTPLKFIPEFFVRKLIPETTKEITRQFNDTLSGFFGTMIARFNNMAKDEKSSPIAQMIGDLLGIRVKKKTDIQTNKYTKGPVPFDGVTRKAITEVIPGYLRRIEGAITGKREIGYDYEAGRFIDFAAAAESMKNNEEYFKALRSSISDFGAVLKKYTAGIQHGSLEEQDRFEGLINTVLNYIAANNGDWTKLTKRGGDSYRYTLARELSSYKGNQKIRTSSGEIKDLSFDDDDIKKIQGIFWQMMNGIPGTDIKGSKEFRAAASKVAGNAMAGQQRYAERMEELEAKGGHLIEVLSDSFTNKHIDKYGAPKLGSFAGSILRTRDEYKKDIFDYLRSLEDNSTWIREFWKNNGARLGGGGTSGRPRHLNMPDMNAIQSRRGTKEESEAEKQKKNIAREAEKYADQAKKSKNKTGQTYIADDEEAWYGASVEHVRQILIREHTEEEKKKNNKEPTFWQDVLGIDPNAKHDYDSKTFLEQLRAAEGIGEKYQVIQKSISKLAEAPMKMIEHTIKKADEAVYHFMFGDADKEVDEDRNPIKGLLAKTIHEMKQTFKKLNEWLNEKMLDPLKKKLDEWGIHSISDALDKITNGRFSDAKNAIADTVLGSKGEDGRRTGGWADPFRKAFSYNWEEVHNRRVAEHRAVQERLREMERKQQSESLKNSEDQLHSSAGGTAGRTKSNILTMLSPGEQLIDSRGKSRTISEAESYRPHMVPKGTTIFNPQPASVRKQQRIAEQEKAIAWATNMKFNADVNDLGLHPEAALKLVFKNEKEKAKFIEQHNYLEENLWIQVGYSDEDSDTWESITNEFEANSKMYFNAMVAADPDDFVKNWTKYRQFKEWVFKVYSILTSPYTKKKGKSVKKDLSKIGYVNGSSPANSEKAKSNKPQRERGVGLDGRQINQGLHKVLSKYTYDDAKPENKARVEKVADFTAKSTIGAGAGLLVGNPLLGLVGGAVAGIVKNNKALNEMLFGDEDHDNGLISKKTQEYLKDAVPTVKKTGLIGGIAGLVTGLGPIPGILMGSAVGFASKNEDLMDTLFGPVDENGERVNLEKIKKAAPRMGIGAAAGALLGPFGLLGGAALGAAGGLFTTTNTFKELLYGELDEDGNPIKDVKGQYNGGIIGALQESFINPLKEFASDMKTRALEFIRDKIVDPIAGAMKPIAAGMKHIAKDVLMAVPNALNWVFEKTLGIPLGDFLRDKVFGPIGRFAKGFLKLPLTIAKGVLSAPGKIIGGIGNAIRGRQIRKGTADYMTAEERLAYRDDHKLQFNIFRRDKMLEEDRTLAAMDKGTVKELADGIELASATQKTASKKYRSALRDLNDYVDEQFRNHGLISTQNNKTKILKAIEAGQIDKAMSLIGKLKNKEGRRLSGEELQDFQNGLIKYINTVEEVKTLRKAVGTREGYDKSALGQWQQKLENAGLKNVDLRSQKQRDRILGLLKAQQKGDNSEYLNTLSDSQRLKAEGINEAISENTSDIKTILTYIAQRLGVDTKEFRDTSKGAKSAEDLINHIAGTASGNGFNEVLYESETGEVLSNENTNKIGRNMAKGIENDVTNSLRSKTKAVNVMAGQFTRDEFLLAERKKIVQDAGIVLTPSSHWTSQDSRVERLFKLISKKKRFNINAAIERAFSTAKFNDNFELAMKNSDGVIVEKEFIDRIADIRKSETQHKALKMAIDAGIDITNNQIFNLDSLNAILELRAGYLKKDNAKNVFKTIAKYIQANHVAPTPAQINAWFSDTTSAKSDLKNTNQQIKRQKESEKWVKKFMNSEESTEVNPDEDDMSSTPDLDDFSDLVFNADANEGTEKVSLFSRIGKALTKKRYGAIGKTVNYFSDLHNRGGGFENPFKTIGNKIDELIEQSKRTADNTEEQVELTEEQEKEAKKQKKEEKKKQKGKDKVNKGPWYERLNNGVETFGDAVRTKGNNILTFLSHPIKMAEKGISGAKTVFDKKAEAGEKASFIDLMQGIYQNQKTEIETLEEQVRNGERKEPFWKRILGAIFGKSAVGIAFKALALPLGVGLFKNNIWPMIKEKAWPWIQNKLFGDPERDDDGFFGRLKYWFKDHVVPFLFGEKNDDGVWVKGWFSGAANFWEQKAKPFIFGEDGNGGVIGKIKDLIKGATYAIADTGKLVWSWLANEDFHPVPETQQLFPGIFKDYQFSDNDKGSTGFGKKLLTTWADGAGAMTEFATKTIIQVLPDVLLGLGKGIVSGVGAWITGKDTSGANNALQKTVNANNYKDAVGQVTNSGSSEDGLLTFNTKYGTFNGAGGGGLTEIGTGSDLDKNGNPISSRYTEYETDSYGAVSELLKSNNPIYDATTDITADLEEIDFWYQKYKNGEDPELAEALELAQKNLVILPMSVFESEDAYKAWITSVFGPEAVESVGWENLMAIDEPYLVYGDSEAYRQVKNRMSRGEKFSLAMFKSLITGGGTGRFLPALLRGGSKVLNVVAKVASKFGFTGKLISVGIKGIAKVTNVAGGLIDTSVKITKNALGDAKAGEALVMDMAEFQAKHPKLIGFTKTVGDFFKGLFESSEFLKQVAELGKTTVSAAKKKIVPLIEKLSKTFVGGLVKKVPNLLKTAGEGLLKALPFINVAFITTAFCNGFFDAQNVLGFNPNGGIISPNLRLISGVVAAVNEVLTAGLVPTDWIAQWFVDNVMIGIFGIEDEYTVAHEAAQRRVDEYNATHDTNLSIREYNAIYHPSESQLMTKDLENFDVGSLFSHWWAGVQDIFSGRAAKNLGLGKVYGSGTFGRAKEALDNIDSFFGQVGNTIDTIAGTAKTTKIFGSGKHVDQRMSNMRYNAPGDTEYQTVADSGCGPAAAVSVLSHYGKGKLEEAAKFSLANGYKEPNGGTYPGFFGDYLGQNGIATNYERDPNNIIGNLKQGNPVILMGTGGGANKSPFDGANGSHYVTATGLDRNGNMIIEDPDERRGGLKYNAKNVLDRTSIAISTHPGRGRKRKFGRSKLPKISKTKYGRGIFGRGYTIDQLDSDGLQDMRVWKDPGNEKDAYIKAISERIHKAASGQVSGIYYRYSNEVATAAVNAGLTTGIDPALALAIGMMESGMGSTPTAKNKLNFWGYNYNDVTWEDGASDFSNGTNGDIKMLEFAFTEWMHRIADNYYAVGQNCLYKMYNNGGHHQYSGEVNDITTNWVVDVAYYMKAIHDVVGQTLDNMSYHPGNGNSSVIDDIAQYLYSTADGFTGMTGTDTTPNKTDIRSYSGDITTTGYDSTAASGSSGNQTIFSMIAEFGKNVLKKIFGPIYDLVFGSTSSSSSYSSGGNYSGSSAGYYDENGNWVNAYQGAENATSFFLKTLQEQNPNAHVSATYNDPSYVKEIGSPHRGIDFATGGVTGLKIFSPVNGVVARTGYENGGYGNFIRVDDEDGIHSHVFAHLNEIPGLSAGQTVERGQQVGISGNTGYSLGPHLHYEVDDYRKEANKYNKGTLGWSVNPDTEYDWSKYLPEEVIENMGAENPLTKIPGYTGHMTDFSNLSTAELIDQYSRWLESTYKTKDKVNDYTSKVNIESLNKSYINELGKRRDLLIQEFSAASHASTDSDYYKKAKSKYDKYYYRLSNLLNYKTIQEEKKQEEIAKEEKMTEGERIAAEREERRAAYLSGPNYVSSDKMTPLARSVLRAVHSKYSEQFSPYISDSAKNLMIYKGEAKSESAILKDLQTNMSWSKYGINWPYPGEFTANGHYSYHDGKYSAGIGYDLNNNWEDAEAAKNFINSNPLIFSNPDYWRLPDVDIMKGSLGKRNNFLREYGDKIGIIQEYMNNLSYDPFGDRYNYGKFWDWYVNRLNNHVDETINLSKQQFGEVAVNPEYYNLAGLGKRFGLGKFNGASAILKKQAEIDKIKDSRGRDAAKRDLNKLVEEYIRENKDLPAISDESKAIGGQSRNISKTLRTAKMVKRPRPVTRHITPTNYGKAKLPTLSTTKTYTNNAVTTTNANSNDIAMINYSKLIITIIELLTSINDNSNKVDKIIDLLRKYGPSFGIDTSGYGKAKTGAEKKAAARHSIVRNHVMDPSWGFAAMDNMNRNDVANKFMEEVQALARE